MPDQSYWDKRRNKIFSTTGGWRVGEGVYLHGYDVLHDLVGDASYLQVLTLSATGRLPERPFADWLEAVMTCLSWPDSRIWCNAIGALAGETNASVIAATVSGVLAGDSHAYGSKTILEGARFITELMRRVSNGESLESCLEEGIKKSRGKVNFTGYARPIATGDERVTALEKYARELGFEIGEHEKLAIKVHNYLHEHYEETMNINGYFAAFVSDQGFTATEMYNISAMFVMAGVESCYLENQPKPYGSFMPLRCDDVEYTGPAKRALS